MHDCPDTCSWIMTTENGSAIALEDDPDPIRYGQVGSTVCARHDGDPWGRCNPLLLCPKEPAVTPLVGTTR